MKQKYTVARDTDKHQLTIQEFAELDKEQLSLLCQETYNADDIKAAISKGKPALISALRTHNMYPPGVYAEKIADSVIRLYDSEDGGSADLYFDDKELFSKAEPAKPTEPENEIKDGEEEIDDILEDDIEDDFEDEKLITNLKSSLPASDEDSESADTT
jgi:hypothetical protein